MVQNIDQKLKELQKEFDENPAKGTKKAGTKYQAHDATQDAVSDFNAADAEAGLLNSHELMKLQAEEFKTMNELKRLPTEEAARLLHFYYNIIKLSGDSNHSTAPLAMYLPKKGIYTTDKELIKREIFKLEEGYTRPQIADVFDKLRYMAALKRPTADANLIPVANGVFNRTTRELEPFSPEYRFTSTIGTRYVERPAAPSWDIDAWLSELAGGDAEVVSLLWQLMNESLNGNATRGKWFLLKGPGGSGKSTFSQFLMYLVGEENTSTLSLENFSDRFSPAFLVGKTLNIGNDIDNTFVRNTSNLQNITTGDPIMIERKGEQPENVTLTPAVLFTANELPQVGNKTEGTYRRMIIVPFLQDFRGRKDDPSIKFDKIRRADVLEYVLHKAINMEFDRFTIPGVVAAELDAYRYKNDPVLEFYEFEWKSLEVSKVDRVPTAYVYNLFKSWSEQNGYRPKGSRTFSGEFLEKLGHPYDNRKARAQEEFFEAAEKDNSGFFYDQEKYKKAVYCYVNTAAE